MSDFVNVLVKAGEFDKFQMVDFYWVPVAFYTREDCGDISSKFKLSGNFVLGQMALVPIAERKVRSSLERSPVLL